MKIHKIPSSISDIATMLIDMNNENIQLLARIETLEKIEIERNERWREASKLIHNLKPCTISKVSLLS